MRKIFVLTLVILLTFSLASCKSKPSKADTRAIIARHNSSQVSDTSGSSVASSALQISSSSSSSSSSASSQATEKSGKSVPAGSSASTPTAVAPQAPAEQPIVFDDPRLEQLLRSYTKKSSGNVYPSDFSTLYSDRLHFRYQSFNNSSTFSSETVEHKANFAVSGMVNSYHALAAIPFKEICLESPLTDNAPNTKYTYDVKDFAGSGALEQFCVYGNHESNFENSHIQSIILKNFRSISQCSNLDYLVLYDAQGVDLSASISLRRLTSATLQDCGITNLAALKSASKLHTLYLGYNPVTDLSPLRGNSSLQDVTLDELSSVDTTTLLSLPNLKTLVLDDCPLISQSVCNQLTQKGVQVTFEKNGWGYYPTLPN